MKKKQESGDMPAVRQRRYDGSGVEDLQPTNAIPRSTKFDLHPVPNWRRPGGVNECAFEQSEPGNEPWTEENRP